MAREPEPTTPNEMRQRLTQIGWGRCMFEDDRMSGVESMVRNIIGMADAEGLSGEDRYTFMAWHLLKAAQSLEQQCLEQIMLAPSPRLIVPVVGPSTQSETR